MESKAVSFFEHVKGCSFCKDYLESFYELKSWRDYFGKQ